MAMQPERIICQVCGVEAPTKYVEYYQNVGMLVARQMNSIKGSLCKNCVHGKFWKMTGVTLAVGWLGTISFFLAPIFIIMNLIRYLGALGMPPVPAGATQPMVDNDVAARVFPLLPTIIERCNRGETLVAVVKDLGPKASVTPGQALMYVSLKLQADRTAVSQAPTGGFPVLPTGSRCGPTTPPPLPASPVQTSAVEAVAPPPVATTLGPTA